MASPQSSAGNGAVASLGCDEPRRSDALEQLHRRVVQAAENAAAYYARRTASKRWWARALRLVAIVLAAIGSMFPVLITLIGGRESIDPTWASVLLACAATAVGLDRFFGFSSAWMRFVTAGMQLQHLREQFDIDWQESIAAWEGRPPSAEQTVGALAVLRKFLREAHRIVRDETDLWFWEFRDSLQQVDVAVQAGRSGRGAATKPPRDGAPPAADADPLPDAPATA